MTGADLSQQQLDAGGGDGVEIGPDRGQRRDVVGRLRHVVEAHHADVLGHVAPAFMQRAEYAEGEMVVAGEHRGHVRHPGENLARPETGGRVPVRRHDRRDLGARLDEGSLPAGEPPLTVEPGVGA
jgi:hypothetical protein